MTVESHETVIAQEDTRTIWGVDAQAHWQRLSDQGVIQRDGSVMLTSPRAIEYFIRHPEILSSNPEASYFGEGVALIPLQVDPPEHVRYRKMLDPIFAPRRMAAHEAAVTALTNDLIDQFIERGACDFSTEFAVPLPSSIFLSVFGLPISDLDKFLEVKDAMIRPQGTTEAEIAQVLDEASGWMAVYFNDALDNRAPGGKCLLDHLLDLEQTGELTRPETLNICMLQLMAGLDTVTCTLECSAAYLAQHPGHRQQLVDDPSLVPAAMEELLRYETPVPTVNRITMVDAEHAGCPITKGDRVTVLLAAFNHDPETFMEPENVDFTRDSNKHFGFGAGVHRCLGSHLARLELRVAMTEWHRRIPDYRLAEGHEVEFAPSLREIPHLPLVFAPGAREG